MIGSAVRRLGSVVIRLTFGVRMHALYLGRCACYERPMLGTPLKYTLTFTLTHTNTHSITFTLDCIHVHVHVHCTILKLSHECLARFDTHALSYINTHSHTHTLTFTCHTHTHTHRFGQPLILRIWRDLTHSQFQSVVLKNMAHYLRDGVHLADVSLSLSLSLSLPSPSLPPSLPLCSFRVTILIKS